LHGLATIDADKDAVLLNKEYMLQHSNHLSVCPFKYNNTSNKKLHLELTNSLLIIYLHLMQSKHQFQLIAQSLTLNLLIHDTSG
jgi:hypothetical protein